MRTFVEVTVLIGIEMNELQKEVAEASYWLRMLMMTVTALHSFTLLISRSFPGIGALRADPPSASQERMGKDLMIQIRGGKEIEQWRILQGFRLSQEQVPRERFWVDGQRCYLKLTASESTREEGCCHCCYGSSCPSLFGMIIVRRHKELRMSSVSSQGCQY